MTRGAAAALWLAAALSVPGPAGAAWDGYQVIMWQDRTPAQVEGLKTLGFTAGRAQATGGEVDHAAQERLRRAGLGFYLGNLATDFFSPYHRWTRGKSVTWLFDDAKARLRAGDAGAFRRDPGLSDPVALRRMCERLAGVARAEAGARPLYYALADEAGIGDLAAAWDADTGASSLAAFQEWLRGEYRDLAALNRQWGTGFATWDDVAPELTDAALRRADENYSAWSDFKAWMDEAFARAVAAGTAAVHGADPEGLAALEGAQVPGWGGYDYARLAPAVDVMEVYDYGNALDIATAFNPALVPLRTSFGRGPREAHAAWRAFLHGVRGTIVWDEADDVVGPDGAAGPRGQEIAALYAAIGNVARALAAARPAPDPVAVLVDQESFRITWLLDRRGGDHDWAARDAEREYDDNAWRAGRRVLVQRLAEVGIQPRFVSTAMLEGDNLGAGTRVLLLPHAIALSDRAVAAVRAFAAAGGTVLADTEPGLFDGHGRRRPAPPLPEVPHPEAVRNTGEATDAAALLAVLAKAGVRPRVEMLGPDGRPATGVEARWYGTGRGTVLALQAARPWGAPGHITLRFPHAMAVSDLRGGPVTEAARMDVPLDGIEPAVLLLRLP